MKLSRELDPARKQQNYLEIIQIVFNTFNSAFSTISTAPDLIINIDETPFFIDSPLSKVIIHSKSTITPIAETFPRTQIVRLAITLEGSSLPVQLICHTADIPPEF